ncbi:MAG: hypothetical protein ABJC13_15035 [Acidobacteriota bacterium]
MIKTFKRRWAEMAPFRESVLVHFTGPGLRRQLQNACEKIADLERRLGPAPPELPADAARRPAN